MAMINTEWMLLLITGWVFSIARKEYELGNGGIEGWRDGGMGKTRVGSLDMQSYNTQTTCQPGHAGPPSPLPLSSSVQGATQSFWYEVWVMDLCLVQRFIPLYSKIPLLSLGLEICITVPFIPALWGKSLSLKFLSESRFEMESPSTQCHNPANLIPSARKRWEGKGQ